MEIPSAILFLMKIANISFALFNNVDLYVKFTEPIQAESIAIRDSVRRTKALSNIDKFVFFFICHCYHNWNESIGPCLNIYKMRPEFAYGGRLINFVGSTWFHVHTALFYPIQLKIPVKFTSATEI